MKTTLLQEFNLPEDSEAFRIQTQAVAMYAALWDIAQEVFRPARKHGYPETRITEVLEAANTVLVKDSDYGHEIGAGSELTSLLEQKFYNILNTHGVELD